MAFSALLLTSFSTNGPQMALSVVSHDFIGQEVLEYIKDFSDFKDEKLYQAIKNMRTSIPGVAAVIGARNIVVVPEVSPIPPCAVSEKCALCLKVASLAFHYYHAIGRNITTANMNYTQVLRTFYIEWEELIRLYKDKKYDVLHLSKNITNIKWIEYFKDSLFLTYGIRDCPLQYVIRDTIDIPYEASDPL